MLRKLFWLWLGVAISFLLLTPVAKAETWIPDYGFYENTNEIKAKDEVKDNLSVIYDYETSANAGGEKITNGHYYVDVKYQGGNNGTDTDHVLLSDIMGKDGVDGKDGLNGEKGDKGDKGDKGENGKDFSPEIAKGLATTDSNLNQRSDDINNRIAELERPQFIIGAELRHIDTRKWTVKTFVDVSTTRHNIDRAGIRFTYKIGTSYEERRLDELQARLDKLEGIKSQIEEASNTEMYHTANSIGIRSKF